MALCVKKRTLKMGPCRGLPLVLAPPASSEMEDIFFFSLVSESSAYEPGDGEWMFKIAEKRNVVLERKGLLKLIILPRYSAFFNIISQQV